MSDGETLQSMGTDASKWADEFDKTMRENPEMVLDPGVTTTWFANAIQAGYDEARLRFEQVPKPSNVFDYTTLEDVKEDPVPEEDWSKQFDRLHEDKDGLPRL